MGSDSGVRLAGWVVLLAGLAYLVGAVGGWLIVGADEDLLAVPVALLAGGLILSIGGFLAIRENKRAGPP